MLESTFFPLGFFAVVAPCAGATGRAGDGFADEELLLASPLAPFELGDDDDELLVLDSASPPLEVPEAVGLLGDDRLTSGVDSPSTAAPAAVGPAGTARSTGVGEALSTTISSLAFAGAGSPIGVGDGLFSMPDTTTTLGPCSGDPSTTVNCGDSVGRGDGCAIDAFWLGIGGRSGVAGDAAESSAAADEGSMRLMSGGIIMVLPSVDASGPIVAAAAGGPSSGVAELELAAARFSSDAGCDDFPVSAGAPGGDATGSERAAAVFSAGGLLRSGSDQSSSSSSSPGSVAAAFAVGRPGRPVPGPLVGAGVWGSIMLGSTVDERSTSGVISLVPCCSMMSSSLPGRR